MILSFPLSKSASFLSSATELFEVLPLLNPQASVRQSTHSLNHARADRSIYLLVKSTHAATGAALGILLGAVSCVFCGFVGGRFGRR